MPHWLKTVLLGPLGSAVYDAITRSSTSEETSLPKDVLIGGTVYAGAKRFLGKPRNTFASEPACGALVYCQLGPVEHTGIYVGSKTIVELGGDGRIRKVGLRGFTDNLVTLDPTIWFPCDVNGGEAVGHNRSYIRAAEWIGKSRAYNMFLDNCHQFCSGCLTGDRDNADNALWMVKDTFARSYDGTLAWVGWEWW